MEEADFDLVSDSERQIEFILEPVVVGERARQLAELASALESFVQKKTTIKRGWFATFLLKLLPPPEPYPSDDLEAVLACVSDMELQNRHDEASARKSRHLHGARPDDYWLYFRSDARSWKNLGGRGGWLVLCRETLRQKAFFAVEMN